MYDRDRARGGRRQGGGVEENDVTVHGVSSVGAAASRPAWSRRPVRQYARRQNCAQAPTAEDSDRGARPTERAALRVYREPSRYRTDEAPGTILSIRPGDFCTRQPNGMRCVRSASGVTASLERALGDAQGGMAGLDADARYLGAAISRASWRRQGNTMGAPRSNAADNLRIHGTKRAPIGHAVS